MQIEHCLKNIRCDTANCHEFASFNINTNGYKKNIYLCEKCFTTLYSEMQKIKRKPKKEKIDE